MQAFLEEIATSIRRAVRPWVVGLRGRGIVGMGAAGDVAFEIDRVAENRLEAALRAFGRPVLYYSEDRGPVSLGCGKPEAVLIVDPIDGTRNARCGFEGCMVSVAAIAGPLPRGADELTVGDVTHACLAEIVGRRVFYAERGRGSGWREGGRTFAPRLSGQTDLYHIAWSLVTAGRPLHLLSGVMGELADRTSLTAGFFTSNSITFSLTRLLTGQLDAALDIANRVCRDRPHTHACFAAAGHGNIIGLCPHDIAAALLVVREAGCTVTDAYGNPLDSVRAFDSSPESLSSCIAAANATLHARLLDYVNAGMARLAG